MGLFGSSDEATEYLGNPCGDYVTPKRIDKVKDVLRPDEKVHYITKLNGAVTGEGETSPWKATGDEDVSLRGYERAVFTNNRVVIKIPKWIGAKERTIPYDGISSIDSESGLIYSKITIRTHSDVYKFSILKPGKDEIREIVSFVQNEIAGPSSGPNTSSEIDPVEQIEKLNELYEKDVISEEEFSEKKQELMDRI